MRNLLRPAIVLVTSSYILLFGTALAGASNLAGTAQSYQADGSVLPGMLVELKPKAPTTVTPLISKDIKSMLGVVIPANAAPVILTPPATSARQVIVAPTGTYNVLVSNQNGSIKPNDYLSTSALPGIAMKAGSDQPMVIGRASAAFNGTNNVIGSESLKAGLGQTLKVSIGVVAANVRLADNPLYQNNSKLPTLLNRAASQLANKTVSPVRIYLSLLVILAVLFISGSMFYGGVRSGIVSIGRNPLAKRAIGRGLFQSILAGLIILVIGAFAAYLILI